QTEVPEEGQVEQPVMDNQDLAPQCVHDRRSGAGVLEQVKDTGVVPDGQAEQANAIRAGVETRRLQVQGDHLGLTEQAENGCGGAQGWSYGSGHESSQVRQYRRLLDALDSSSSIPHRWHRHGTTGRLPVSRSMQTGH